jgi:hypothetical protein
MIYPATLAIFLPNHYDDRNYTQLRVKLELLMSPPHQKVIKVNFKTAKN